MTADAVEPKNRVLNRWFPKLARKFKCVCGKEGNTADSECLGASNKHAFFRCACGRLCELRIAK